MHGVWPAKNRPANKLVQETGQLLKRVTVKLLPEVNLAVNNISVVY
jgi:hypothetical protein